MPNENSIFSIRNVQRRILFLEEQIKQLIAGTLGSSGGGNAGPVDSGLKEMKLTFKGDWIETTSGLLEIGKTYVTEGLEVGDDFSNVGWVTDGVAFVATGTTPTTWTNGTYVFHQTDSQPIVEIASNDFEGVTVTSAVTTYNDSTITLSSAILTLDKTFIANGFGTRVDGSTISFNPSSNTSLMEIIVVD